MKIPAIHFDPGGEPEHPIYGTQCWIPGRIMTGGGEMRGDRAAICPTKEMVIVILLGLFSARKPQRIQVSPEEVAAQTLEYLYEGHMRYLKESDEGAS